ncbi:MAG: transglycosylase SLT domain-containing protein [Rhodospirillaceae bacterium]|nr:transglycosylase SLT domain-containing protein [Rhodospirillaceae bacterium]
MEVHRASSTTPVKRPWQRFRSTLILAATLTIVSCTSQFIDSTTPTIVPLFDALQGSDHAKVRAILQSSREHLAHGPTWPIVMYLRGEAYLELADTGNARDAFRALASWAVSDHPFGPYRDTWGGSGLAVVALWRWLQLADAHGLTHPDELDHLLDTATKLQETRFYSTMVRSRLLPALPLLEERIRSLLAELAWAHGRRDHAKLLYLDFLAVNSDETQLVGDDAIRSQILREGLATPDRLDLYAALRQLSFPWPRPKTDAAARTLKRLYDDSDTLPDVRVLAGFEWAYYMRSRNRQEATDVLTHVLESTADEDLVQRALYRRGLVQRAADDRTGFQDDMRLILARFPDGALADDALAQLAADHLYRGDFDQALARYAELRNGAATAEHRFSAHLQPALVLFSRGDPASLDSAARLLRDYVLTDQAVDYRRRALFWRGRIAERRGDAETARALFRQLLDEVPYDYYGLRAGMHLELGEIASRHSVPAPHTETYRDLHTAYAESELSIVPDSVESTPYHHRVREAIRIRLYDRVLANVGELGQRIDDVSLVDLDRSRRIPAAALLLSLRQDALAAKDRNLDPENWLPLMASVSGPRLQDWPLSVEMAFLRDDAERRRWYGLQRDGQYLATLYPDLERIPALAEPLAAMAWEIDGSRALSQALMYAVIRHESGFYPQAISARGALGLFQFMPGTFRALTREGGVVADVGESSAVDYLLDPGRNVRLWARWVAAEFPIEERGRIVSSVMRHQAGTGNVLEWRDFWRGAGALDDVEFQIETTPFAGTGGFLRRVLRDTTIVEAAGIFED